MDTLLPSSSPSLPSMTIYRCRTNLSLKSHDNMRILHTSANPDSINSSHLECFGGVLQVNAGDEPAIRWALGRPEHLIEALSVYALLHLQGGTACDLIDHPETAPVLLVHIWTQKNRLSLVLLDLLFDCDEVSWVKQKENNIHGKSLCVQLGRQINVFSSDRSLTKLLLHD